MELFGINGPEFLVLLVIVVIVAGPKGLTQFINLLKNGLAQVRSWSARLRQESNLSALAAELQIDPAKLDLRQYDPRALVREAVREEMKAWTSQAAAGGSDQPTVANQLGGTQP